MPTPPERKKQFRRIGHHLNPIVTVAERGLEDGVIAETERALSDHELIKVRFVVADREERQQLMAQLAQETQAELIQQIGKMGLYYRRAAKPNARLSNVLRFANA